MAYFLKRLLIFLLASSLVSCGTLKKTSLENFQEGYYRLPAKQPYFIEGKDSGHTYDKPIRIYLYNQNDTLWFAPVSISQEKTTAKYIYPFHKKNYHKIRLKKTSFDFDVFTTPFKLRPAAESVPHQLNTTFNGSFYLGYRMDHYSVSKLQTPSGLTRELFHKTGYGFGGFIGIGSAFINPKFMRNMIDYEYDAFVIDYGVSFLFGYRNISTGISVGFDFLTDKNKRNWIYQHKPWIGIFIGLNLN